MTDLASDAKYWNVRLIRMRVKLPAPPEEPMGAGGCLLLALSFLAMISGTAIVTSDPSRNWGGVILALTGAVGTQVRGILSAISSSEPALRGDSRIEIKVADEGVVVRGGLAITWDEVSHVSIEWPPAPLKTLASDPVLRSFRIALKDHRSVLARATSLAQQTVVVAPHLSTPGYLRVEQYARSRDEMQELFEALTVQCQNHGVPLNPVAST